MHSRSRLSLNADVEQWLEQGDEARLEQLLLEGRAYLLENRDLLAASGKAAGFLRLLPVYKVGCRSVTHSRECAEHKFEGEMVPEV